MKARLVAVAISFLFAFAPAFSQVDEIKEQELCRDLLGVDSDLLGVVLFDLGDSGISREGRLIAVAITAELERTDPNYQRQLLVVGHADQSGGDSPNLQLSMRRATNVSAEILKNDKARSFLSTAGCGQSFPLLPLSPEAAHPHNRRVELRLKALAAP